MFNRGDVLAQYAENPNAGLSKKQMYKTLSRDIYLPDEESRVSSKEYYEKVMNREVFVMPRSDLLLFETNLSPEEKIKSAFFSISAFRPR